MEVNFPWPIWNRIQIVTLYPKPDQENEEQICFFSSKGNETQTEKYFTEDDKKNFVLMTQSIGGWILTPIKDGDGNVIATNMKFAQASDVGGYLPDAIVNSQVPAAVASMTAGTIEWVRKNKK